MKIQSTSGNPMGYDLAFGSPPIQDSQLVERLQGFQGESLAHFQQVLQDIFSDTELTHFC